MKEKLFTYDLSKLEPGDIILSTTREKKSAGIRLATLSRFSHAMLYTHLSIIHADGDGVFSTNPQRRLFAGGDSIVLRAKKPESVNLVAACNFARDRVGTLYSVPEAAAAALLRKSRITALSSNQFCSRLVAQAYRAGGLDLVERPDFCVPEDIKRSDHLFEISAIREATEADIRLADTKDTVKIHLQNTFSWLRKVRNLAKTLGTRVDSVNEALNFISQNPDLDQVILDAVQQSGYLDDYKMDCEINPYRYSDSAMLALLSGRPDWEVGDILQKELAINSDIASNVAAALKTLPVGRLRTLQAIRVMHICRLEQLRSRVRVLKKVAGVHHQLEAERHADYLLHELMHNS